MSSETSTATSWKPSLEGASIVLLGSFNPPIFQPTWFAAKALLRQKEAETAANLVVSAEITVFSTDWLQLQVTRERFAASTSDPSQYGALRDLVLGTFVLLEHTPFNRMGLNHVAHFAMPSEEELHALGDHLAPKDAWRDLFDGRIGMRSLTIEAKRPGSSAKYIRVKVEPSLKTLHGVFFEVNEHHEVEESAEATRMLLGVLKESWDNARDYASRVPQHLLRQTS